MRAAAVTRIELAHLVDEFRAARAARDLVDFSDQMRFGARLAEECPDVGAALRDQFRVVLLDEYQDTSVSQRRLLVGLFGGGHPVTAVGDPLQAIYGWRGASVANIDRFPEHFARRRRQPAPVLHAGGEPPLRPAHPRRGQRPRRAAARAAPAGRAAGLAAEPESAGGLRVALLPTYAEEMAWVGDRVASRSMPAPRPGDIARALPCHLRLSRRWCARSPTAGSRSRSSGSTACSRCPRWRR